jgi:hypothetical protein
MVTVLSPAFPPPLLLLVVAAGVGPGVLGLLVDRVPVVGAALLRGGAGAGV